MTLLKVKVQEADFALQQEYQTLLNEQTVSGAVVTFVGLVRDFNDGREVHGLVLEHYPAMTEKMLTQIASKAQQRWQLNAISIIHRVGRLSLGEQIVFVGVASQHRGDAFSACEFIMDYLKTQAPFWKKEATSQGDVWVEAKGSDKDKADSWDSDTQTAAPSTDAS